MTTETKVHPIILNILEKNSCGSSICQDSAKPTQQNGMATEDLIIIEEAKEVELSLDEIWDKAGEIWDKVTDEAEEFFDDIIEDVDEFINDVGDQVKEIWSKLSDEGQEIANNAIDKVKDEAIDFIQNQAEEIVLKFVEDTLSKENPDASRENADDDLALPLYPLSDLDLSIPTYDTSMPEIESNVMVIA
jgi:uncharacterized protein YoxC